MFRSRILATLLLLTACGDDGPNNSTGTSPTSLSTTVTPSTTMNDPSGSTTGDPTGTTTPTSTTSSAEGAPVFLSFGTNVAMFTEGESVTFTAVLTDPDGVEDIVGGTLRSTDESLEFGPFVAAGQPGTYSISLSWAQIHQTSPIQFDGGEETRGFRAVFFDQAANKAIDDVDLTLVCAAGAACDGACVDLALDGSNCGACGRICDGGEDACESGNCAPAYGTCVNFDVGMVTCAEICQDAGETCVTHGCQGDATALFFDDLGECMAISGEVYGSLTCDEVHQWGPNSAAIRCCCTDTK